MVKRIATVCLALLCAFFFAYKTKENEQSVEVFQAYAEERAEEYAEKLLKEIYGNRVTFRRVHGDDTTFRTRYYCSNICVDACADGSVRYLCDIRSAGSEDPLLKWLCDGVDTAVMRSETQNGIEYRKVQNKRCTAELSILQQTGRVFAAKIIFFS